MPVASAHEVYVLNSTIVQEDLGNASTMVFQETFNNPSQAIIIWGFIAAILIGTIIVIYLTHTKWALHLEKNFDFIRPYAALIIRLGLAISLIFGALNHNLYGPEIVIANSFAGASHGIFLIPYGDVITVLEFAVGIFILFGLFTRLAGLAGGIIYLFAATHLGLYALNYINYFGETLVIIIEGATLFSIDTLLRKKTRHPLKEHVSKLHDWLMNFGERYTFPIVRISFGIALLYAAISLKFLHSLLTFDVVRDYHLGWGLNPATFTVLFGIAELVMALFILLGILLREATAATTIALVSSILFFGEDVWPHILLLALCIGIFMHGEDTFCLTDWLYKKERDAVDVVEGKN